MSQFKSDTPNTSEADTPKYDFNQKINFADRFKVYQNMDISKANDQYKGLKQTVYQFYENIFDMVDADQIFLEKSKRWLFDYKEMKDSDNDYSEQILSTIEDIFFTMLQK